MHTELATEKAIDGGVHILTVGGPRLVSDAASEFREMVRDRIKSGIGKIIIDLSNVDFIDSMGIGAIVAAKKSLQQDGRLIITGANQNVMTMFQLTRLDQVFQILASQDEAIHVLQM